MSSQSPKSQRPKAPGETPASDSNVVEKKGGQSAANHAPSGSGKPKVPNLNFSGGRSPGQGTVKADPSPVSTTSAAPHQGGGPGFAGGGDQDRKGGTVHKT